MIDDARKYRPAARCRSCGCITWVSSLARKVKIARAKHVEGCPRPRGRLDLIAEVPVDLRADLFQGHLDKPLSDAALVRLGESWNRFRETSASTSHAGPAPETGPPRKS